jgi:hypothetical protein
MRTEEEQRDPKTWVREVSGLTALPNPVFWIMTAVRLPPIAAPTA